MARFQKRKLSKKETSALKKEEGVRSNFVAQKQVEKTEVTKKEIEIPSVISVKDFADIAELPVTTVISNLMKNGILANINENIDFETAQIIGDDLGFIVKQKSTESEIARPAKVVLKGKNLVSRPPIVAVMGHVDHGKTTLLDKIRQAHVADGESGGITQHISAFQVLAETKDKKKRAITFIDTPGHAAFTTMRSHGTAITDIVVLVVAADDGVMPQTVEVIEQAKKSNVPIIVAINKIDKPDTDLNKVKQQLADQGLTSEEWGGETITLELSAATGQGVDKLLEAILLLSDLKDFRADPGTRAVGVVIESHMHKGSGPLAVVLIENGTLKKGDPVVVGNFWGRIRILQDSAIRDILEAGPSLPVRIAGLNGLPTFGDRLLAVTGEKEAKEQAEVQRRSESVKDFVTAKKVESKEGEKEAETYELNLVVKADVRGSLEAIKQSLQDIHHPEVKLKIVHEGIGTVSESDVNMANASKATLISFRVGILGASKRLAELEKVNLKSFEVIYDLINEVKAEMSELLPPEIREIENGRLRILATFRFDRKKTIFGGIVESGELNRDDAIKILRGEKLVYSGKISALRQGKDETASVQSGSECGISVDEMVDVLKDDIVVAYHTEEIKRTVE